MSLLTEGEISSSFLPVKICTVSFAPYHLRPKVTHISGDQVDLGVTVLSSLGGRHVDDLAGSSLDENVTRLPERRALHAVIISKCSCR
jgi:hypothetical protein